MAEKSFRKHFLVLPSYQLRLVGFLVVLLFVGSLIHGFFLYSIAAKSVEEGFLSIHNRFRSTWEILRPAIILTNGASFLLLSLSFLAVGILISHRLIGPLFKMANRIREMNEGNFSLPPIKLRQGDEGQILSDSINRLQENLRERFAILFELKKKLEKGSPLGVDEVRGAIEKALKNLRFDEK